jgi:hypothetical protein
VDGPAEELAEKLIARAKSQLTALKRELIFQGLTAHE